MAHPRTDAETRKQVSSVTADPRATLYDVGRSYTYSGAPHRLAVALINDNGSDTVRDFASKLIAKDADTNARTVVEIGGYRICRAICVFAGALIADIAREHR